jgi:probable HAF family extracellular repeat protein
MWFRTLFDALRAARPRTPGRPAPCRLSVEALDDRIVPSAYSILEIPLLPQDVNARGQVVGRIPDGPAALWQDGTLTSLGSLAGPGGWSAATAINDAGQVVGSTQVTPSDSQGAAFLVTPEDTDQDGTPDRWYRDDNQDGANDLMAVLPAFGETGNRAWDINTAGQVVGTSGSRAVLWQDGALVDLGTLAATSVYDYATGINDAGQVVGTSDRFAFLLNPEDTDGDGTPDRWYRDADNDGTKDLMVAMGQWGGGTSAISSGGHVVGSDGYAQFLWTPSEPNGTNGSLEYLDFSPSDVNASGLVVGAYAWSVGDGGEGEYGSSGSVAVLWENGETYNPGGLLPADSGWPDLYSADAINDGGWIAGTTDGRSGYVMIPTGEEIPPLVRIGDATVTEGNGGTTAATFTVTLSKPSSQTVTVSYATAADASALAGDDYRAVAGTLTFAPGETVKTVTVLVSGDRRAELNEMFLIDLTGATGAIIADGGGLGTILDDEPSIGTGHVSRLEGNSGTTVFRFAVTLSVAYDEAVTIGFSTVDETANAGGDYAARSGTLTFAPGETVKYIDVIVYGDTTREADETFYVQIYGVSSNARFTNQWGLGSIVNDDGSTGPGSKGGKKK